MRVVSDLHIHSRFARACSTKITIPALEQGARLKGLSVLGTGDFQHPRWSVELKNELSDENNTGVYRTKTGFPFIHQTEISLVYTDLGKGRRVHHLVLAPSRDVADQFTEYLKKKGRIDYDGRPIFNITSAQFVEDLRSISPDIEVIPAHAWTPWFGVFGDKTGYNALKDCFHDQAKHIHAIETGLSSDPGMNWRLSQLKDIQLVSFSDMHSATPWRIGREATVLEMKELTYKNILNAIRTGNGITETLEFFPEEGKYHYDGHRACEVVMSPQEALAMKKLCPKCTKPLTIGVAHRVEELADLPEGSKHAKSRPYRKLIPLAELVAHAIGSPVASPKTFKAYNDLVSQFGNELAVVLDAPEEQLRKAASGEIVELILKNRTQHIDWHPGYDGEYGHPVFEPHAEPPKKLAHAPVKKTQKSLGEF
jgi:uncharacterized protein (TIGR00375 family)